MRPIIEFCISNMHNGTEAVKNRLEQNPEYDVIEYGCLGNCGQCFLSPYALVNGELISAAEAEELYQLILDTIRRHEEESSAFDFIDEE